MEQQVKKYTIKELALFFLKGMLIGAAAIAPGISGSSMAVSFGIYHQIIDIIAGMPKTILRYRYFILIVLLGLATGFFLLALISEIIINAGFGLPLFFAFGGMMIGTIPGLAKDNLKHRHKPIHYAMALLAFSLALTLGIVSYLYGNKDGGNANFALYLLYGMILGVGVVLPGLSGATVLLILGIYAQLMSAVAKLEFMVLIPTGIGGLVAIIVFAKIISLLFKKYPHQLNLIIFGFVLGSIPAIFMNSMEDISGLKGTLKLLLGIALALLTAIFTFWQSKLEEKAKQKNIELETKN